MLPLGRNKVEGWIRPTGLVFATCGIGSIADLNLGSSNFLQEF